MRWVEALRRPSSFPAPAAREMPRRAPHAVRFLRTARVQAEALDVEALVEAGADGAAVSAEALRGFQAPRLISMLNWEHRTAVPAAMPKTKKDLILRGL